MLNTADTNQIKFDLEYSFIEIHQTMALQKNL